MKKIFLLILLFIFLNYSVLNTQQTATIVVNAQPQQVLLFGIDGTDQGWGMSRDERCDFGNLDARGSPITGAPSGNPNVNGIRGTPVDSTGLPLSSSNDPACIGSFYPLFSQTGGNFWTRHPNSALAIRIFSWGRWQLTVSAQLIANTQNVTIDQLKWKDDSTSAIGYQGYTDFSTSNVLIASGGFTFRFFYHDYGLLVEYEDEPGTNIWRITYTITSI
ncbi:hypothetical protein NLD30_11340 [SCandidatus Aminicenantes bacterium Aminicenantia_JdfR_composite]|jgi:hypothetical protein|nr:hypothetical protein [SCandidatus Aminicenantes bacterium Aminicenantia_JdfR_composite]MCP2597670.1 hypothetical protein [Candidatus Aminicenantes bacterium AC-335-G13]